MIDERTAWFAASAASNYLNVSERTLRTWTSLGTLHPARIGRVVRYSRAELDAVMAAGQGAVVPPTPSIVVPARLDGRAARRVG